MDYRQQPLFYDFCLEALVPYDHLLRRIAKVLDLSDVRQKFAPYYSVMGRPSLDPELMIRMLLIGYLYGIRSERRLVEEVQILEFCNMRGPQLHRVFRADRAKQPLLESDKRYRTKDKSHACERTFLSTVNRTKMFHVKHFGTIGPRNRTGA